MLTQNGKLLVITLTTRTDSTGLPVFILISDQKGATSLTRLQEWKGSRSLDALRFLSEASSHVMIRFWSTG